MNVLLLNEEPLLESLVLCYEIESERIQLIVSLAFGFEERSGKNQVIFRRVVFCGVNDLVETFAIRTYQMVPEVSGAWVITRDVVNLERADLCISSRGCMEFSFATVTVEDRRGNATKASGGEWDYKDDRGQAINFYQPFE